ncbi:hypothetical protein D3C80_1453810 [compost metagenome]
MRLGQFFGLPLPLFVEATDTGEGFFDVGKPVDDRASIGFQQFLLTGHGLVAFGAEAAVVEDRCDQPGRQVVERAAQGVVEGVGARTEAGTQGHAGQHRRTGNDDVGLGRSQLGFCTGDVRAAAEQVAG